MNDSILRPVLATLSSPSSEAAGFKDRALLNQETASAHQKKKPVFHPLRELVTENKKLYHMEQVRLWN